MGKHLREVRAVSIMLLVLVACLLALAAPGPRAAQADAALSLVWVAPSPGQPWQVVEVYGAGFGAERGSSYVSFGSTPASEYMSWSDNRVLCKVPPLPAGEVQVTVVTAGGASNGVSFTVSRPGQGWIYQDSKSPRHLESVFALDPETCWAVGAGGAILKTSDGGSNWSAQASGVSGSLFCVSAASRQVAWAGGEGCLLKTGDGGASWGAQLAHANYVVLAVSAVNENVCWAAGGYADYSGGGFVIRTVDGGKNWAGVYFDGGRVLRCVSAFDAATAWVAGASGAGGGVILRTNDGGANWSVKETKSPLYDFAALDRNTAWTIGVYWEDFRYKLEFLKTSDGGNTWTASAGGIDPEGDSVQLLDAATAWAVSHSAGIVKTYDGLSAVTVQAGAGAIRLKDISACDLNVAWAVGEYGTILHTVDGGEGKPVPVVKAVNPSSGTQNTVVSISGLAGSGFATGAAVRLESGGTAVNASNVRVISGTLIVCDLNLSGVPAGTYDVVVRNPDGKEGRLRGGFTVTVPPIVCGQGAGAAMLPFGLVMGLLSLAGSGGLLRRRRRGRKAKS